MMMRDFSRFKRNTKKISCNLPGVTKLIINEQDVSVRTCKKVDYTTLKLYENKGRAWRSHQRHHHFGSDTPTCMTCLEELQKQQIIGQKVYDQKLMEVMMRKLHRRDFKEISWWMAIGWYIREQVRCWILKLIRHTEKTSFKLIFIVFMDHKITCHKVEELHILNGIDTLDTWSVCNFS